MIKKVSIITVTYNARETLGATINSVLDQTYTNIEFIVIDGRSTDGTVDIIKSFDSRIAYWCSEKDRGIYDAMNKGISAATGDWIYFLGADDIFINNTVLTDIHEKLESENVGFLYGNVKLKSNNVIMGGSRSYRELIGRNISHQAIFYKTDIFKKKGLYNINYKILADYDMNLRIFEDRTIVKEYIPVNICLFNDKGGASNVTIDCAFFKDKLQQFLVSDNFRLHDPILQQYYFYYGVILLLHERNARGLKYCLNAFGFGPRKIFYFLVFIKYILGTAGIGAQIKFI